MPTPPKSDSDRKTAGASVRKATRRRTSESEIRRRQSILAAARKLVARVGYENFTMQDLAAESEVALGTLYNYYQGKEDIVGAAYEEQHGIVFSRMEREDAYRGVDRLIFIVDAAIAEMQPHQKYAREMATKYPSNSHSAGARAIRARVYGRAVAEMKEDGTLVDWVDPGFLTWQLTETLQLPLLGWVAGNVPEDLMGDYARYVLCAALDGLTVEPVRTRLTAMARDLASRLSMLRA